MLLIILILTDKVFERFSYNIWNIYAFIPEDAVHADSESLFWKRYREGFFRAELIRRRKLKLYCVTFSDSLGSRSAGIDLQDLIHDLL